MAIMIMIEVQLEIEIIAESFGFPYCSINYYGHLLFFPHNGDGLIR